jgi:lactoylglutathione lyase
LSEHEVRMIILSTDDLDESIRFYSETLGMPLKFRDGAHFAALDGGPVTLAQATAVDHPIPGQVVVGIKTADVDAAAKAVEASGGGIVKGPYDDAHERRAVVYDKQRQRLGLLQAAGPVKGVSSQRSAGPGRDSTTTLMTRGRSSR